jgi:glucose/arabinose dehydrogenase
MIRGSAALLLLSISLLALASSACGGDDDGGGGSEGPRFSFGLSSQAVVGDGDADNVSAIAFAPDGRMFYAEQMKGRVMIVGSDGTLQPDPFVQVSVADYLGLDWGLTGLALDPDFETNHYVYLFYSEPTGATEPPVAQPKIVRYAESSGAATEPTLITADFPPTFAEHPGYNANGELHFGPDGFLYASVGDYDAANQALSQDLSTPIGKLLRMNKADGAAAPGNPFENEEGADARIYALGFREPFPFAFDGGGNLYGTDNTPVSCEELNLIVAGGNYGWPNVGEFPFADCSAGTGEQPIFNLAREGRAPGDFLSFVEASGLSFLTGSAYTSLTDSLIVCESQESEVEGVVTDGMLRRLVLTGPDQVSASETIVNDCKGEARAFRGEVYYADATSIQKLVQGQQAPSPGG